MTEMLKSPVARVLGAILLACFAITVLPANKDAVINQQIRHSIPKLASKLGTGPWSLAPDTSPAHQNAFGEAQSQRASQPTGTAAIVFSIESQTNGLLLRATQSPDTTQEKFLPQITNWSLLPPVLAILVAMISGRLILGLSLAIFSGSILSLAGSLPFYQLPFFAISKSLITYVWSPLESSFQLYILAFTAGLIGMVRVTTLSGGNRGIADLLAARAAGARSTRLAAFFMGLAIFFDDYANTIVVGSTLRPIADRFRVSREKLAYIVDSTAAPIAGVALISTWIGYEVSLFQDLMEELNTGMSGYELFFNALPMRFYCLLTLAFVFLSSYLQRDYGTMLKAEQRAFSTGQVLRPGATPMTGRANDEIQPAEGIEAVWWAAMVPVAIVILFVIGGMVYDTAQNEAVLTAQQNYGIFSTQYWTATFSNADTARVLFIASIAGSIIAVLIAITRKHSQSQQRTITLIDALTTWAKGIVGVWYAIAILILAWAIKEVCTDVGTSTYLTAALSPFVSPLLLPLLIFLLASVVAFSIGTSWTTMAILIPTVVPLAHALGGLPLTILAAAAVLDGAIFGDHCSPISDTTVMSSIASSCDHLDHVKTQLPYALTTMSLAGLFGYLGTAGIYPSWVGLLLGLIAIPIILLTIGKDPEQPAQN
ncbi:MAG: Na+/H+ antiporter NhaC family protein [Candidatus Latescibacteria bacterium]|nr:Na+/H+ antiporter NhaC family protein [Candidatus Latescibacterota bacterium]MBT4138121.1 Na+/H+ antiporter NhaC family protein [Candidatus Latescibacterota bacterium]